MSFAFVMLAFLPIAPVSLHGQADYKRYFDEDNIPKVREYFRSGRYEIVVQVCDYALRRGQPSWEWRTLRFESLSRLGRYEEAVAEAIATTDTFPESLGALLRAHELFESMGLEENAASIHDRINKAAAAVPKEERTALDYVFLGEAALILGADPSKVIEQYFGVAKSFQPKGESIPEGLIEAFLAAGNLALEKDDYARAAEEFRGAYKLAPNHPYVLFGLAEAFLPSDRKTGIEYLERVLEESPFHDGALLYQAEYAITTELYPEARELLERVESVNPRHPLAAAYRAVIAELEWNDHAAFEEARTAALSVWKNNPEIDHLIGRVLSVRYRHEEGADSQKRALAFDPDFLPAKLQLASDYLRLGLVEEAWPLVEAVGREDEYNVMAYNLELLRAEMESFASIESDNLIIRMPPDEAAIYGDRVLELLTEARDVLGAKYGIEIEVPTLIEFYPNQQDFAIRTFGSLGGEGLLGVCFGSVITMNSPGSVTAGKSNWEATLWHEYAHVITLTATRNKMPRWLSEGISVYEEKLRDANWGQRMTPRYREMILDESALTSIGEMSRVFFNAENIEQVLFAYYQSMLVVEYLVDTFGFEALRGILADLGEGVLIDDALARHTQPVDELNLAFGVYAMELAANFGPGVDWTEPGEEEVDRRNPLAIAAFLEEKPNNFWARQRVTSSLLEEEKWREAAASADELIRLLPEFAGGGNGYSFKSIALREMGDLEGEADVLEQLAQLSAETLMTYHRLLEHEFEAGNWSAVLRNARRASAIDPFSDRLHYCLGCALTEEEDTEAAVAAFEKTLLLDPPNPSEVRFRMAGLLHDTDPLRARRVLYDSLADSLRYREAYERLLVFEKAEEAAFEEPVPVEEPAISSSEAPSSEGESADELDR
ncbi:MAG: tetratricopeptide repeat protein [Verrucomicrobiota bacterium]